MKYANVLSIQWPFSSLPSLLQLWCAAGRDRGIQTSAYCAVMELSDAATPLLRSAHVSTPTSLPSSREITIS